MYLLGHCRPPHPDHISLSDPLDHTLFQGGHIISITHGPELAAVSLILKRQVQQCHFNVCMRDIYSN